MPNMKLGRLSKVKSLCERRLICVCPFVHVLLVRDAVRAYKLGG